MASPMDTAKAYGVRRGGVPAVQYLCEEIMVMNADIVGEHGRMDDMFAPPRHDDTRMPLDAVLPLPGTS